jgi:FKBP-type peptidyl-prolyl cis-trans isomerase 2
MARPLVRDEEGVSTFWSFVGVLVLVIAILSVYFVYVVPKSGHPPLRAENGDQVKVDYIGRFENGLVFDTSLRSVAEDNASYTKAFSFGWRNSWAPLPFTIGTVPPAVIQGFDVGVQGLAIGDAKTIVVPPNLGYGSADPTKIVVKPLFEKVAVRVMMNESAFTTTYKTQAVSGANVTDPFWHWPATVSVSASIVTVTNSPIPGQAVHPYGQWDARVDSVDDGADNGTGRIVVHHLLDAASIDRVGQRGASGAVVFTVTAVDLAAGTYTLNYNNPVKGRNLVFEVTMLAITRVA